MQQSVRRRYLQAMGIDCYVRRTPAGETTDPEVEPAAPARTTAVSLAQRPVAAVRQLLDTEVAASREGEAAALVQASVDRSSDHRSSDHRPSDHRPSADTPAAADVPRFRLSVLELGGSVLLLDEALLSPGEMRSEQLQLLADLLRTARMLYHGDGAGEVQIQVFYWPQVEDLSLDQSTPRAREALTHYLRSRTQGRGPLLALGEPDAAADSASAIASSSVSGLDVAVIRLDPGLLDPTAPGAVRAAAWQALQAGDAAS